MLKWPPQDFGWVLKSPEMKTSGPQRPGQASRLTQEGSSTVRPGYFYVLVVPWLFGLYCQPNCQPQLLQMERFRFGPAHVCTSNNPIKTGFIGDPAAL